MDLDLELQDDLRALLEASEEVVHDVQQKELSLNFNSEVFAEEAEQIIEGCGDASRAQMLAAAAMEDIKTTAKAVKRVIGNFFPELEQIVPEPLQYLRVVCGAGKSLNFSLCTADIVGNQRAISIQMGAAMIDPYEALPEASRTLSLALRGLEISELRSKLLCFLSQRVSREAPNLVALTGASTAADLLAAAGGLDNLSKMVAQNTILLGVAEKTFSATGGATTATDRNFGTLARSTFVKSYDPKFRPRAIRQMSGKVVLAARSDALGGKRDGSYGQMLRKKIVSKLENIAKPPAVLAARALPKPREGGSGKHRAGRRIQARKLRLGQTRLAKEHNKMAFGQSEDGEDMPSDEMG